VSRRRNPSSIRGSLPDATLLVQSTAEAKPDGTTRQAFDSARGVGQAQREARDPARAAVINADAVTHERSATRADVELVVTAIEAVVKVITILARRS
jgi:hypothetical protein